MGKINFANIQSALGKAKEAAAPLQNKGHTENVPVDFIVLADKNIYNESDNDESIKELADNIEACGLLHPITVNKIGTEKYQIISGERRFRAITEYLQWKSVPCMVFEGLSSEAAQLKLCMANLAVREYTASQKYKFYLEVKALLEKMKASGEYKGGLQKGIAEILNVTKRQVAKYSSIEKLPPDVQQQVIDGTISINKAVEMTVSTHTDSESKNDSFIGSLSDLVSSLSETARNRILSGEVDLEALLSVSSEKDEPVHLFEPDNATTFPKNEGTASEKDEPVHHFEPDNDTAFPKNEGTASKKDEPVHLFEPDNDTAFSKNEGTASKKNEPVHHFEYGNDTAYSKNKDTVTKKDEPVHHFEPDNDTAFPKNEGTASKKDEPVHHFEPDNDTAFPKNEDTASENDEPVHHFEADSNTSPELPDIQIQARSPSTESKSKENGSVLIFKDGMFIPNKIQVIEEHESYTVFKVFAVKQ